MPGGVLILRIVTATDMSTGETEAQVHPGITDFQAVLAPIGAWRDFTYLVEVATLLCHVCMFSFLIGRHRTTRATQWVPTGSLTGLVEVACLGWLPGYTATSRSLRSDVQ